MADSTNVTQFYDRTSDSPSLILEGTSKPKCTFLESFSLETSSQLICWRHEEAHGPLNCLGMGGVEGLDTVTDDL